MASAVADSIARAASGQRLKGFDPFTTVEGKLIEISTEEIVPDPKQPRKDLGDLDGLIASIKAHGIQSPPVVSPRKEGGFMVIAGHRRLEAAKQLGLSTISAIVRTVEDHVRLELQLIENVQRKDFNDLEEALAYKRLMEEFGLSQGKVADRVGKSRQSINDSLRLLDLPAEIQTEYQASPEVQGAVNRSLLTFITRAPKREQQPLWEKAKEGKLTVAAARQQLQTRKERQTIQGPAHEKRSTVLSEVGLKVTLTVERLADAKKPHAPLSPKEVLEAGRSLMKELSRAKEDVV